ncbi:MAG: hypothetical protein ACTTH5_06245 [Wolinella sp.]
MRINTGTPRSVTGHFVSGSVASLIMAGVENYQRLQRGEIESREAGIDTLKKTLQGGILTASAIATANHIGTSGFLRALATLSVGAACVYGVERGVDMLLDPQKLITHKK